MRGAEGVFVFVAIETKATFGLIRSDQGWGNVRQLLLSRLQPCTPQLGDVQLLRHLNGHICDRNGGKRVTLAAPWGPPGEITWGSSKPCPTPWHCSVIKSCSERFQSRGSWCHVMVGLGIRTPGL